MNNYTKEQIYEYGMRDISGYEGLYAITSCGRVWSYRRKIFLKPIKSKDGYLKINLYKNNKLKTYQIHRLVLMTYKPVDGMENLQVNHKSEIKTENYLNNLEWMTAKENLNYGTRNKRAGISLGKTVRCIETKKVYFSTNEAERQTGIAHQSISKVCRSKLKSAGDKHWVYETDYQDMLIAQLLEIAFCGDEESETDGSELVSVCGQPLNEYLQTKNN